MQGEKVSSLMEVTILEKTKDVVRNELLVASGESNDWLLSDTCLVSGVNWLGKAKPQGTLTCCAKFRYRQKDNPVTLEFLDETTVKLTYPQQVASVTPGQQAVFYLEDQCLGGGVIEEVWHKGQSLTDRVRSFEQ